MPLKARIKHWISVAGVEQQQNETRDTMYHRTESSGIPVSRVDRPQVFRLSDIDATDSLDVVGVFNHAVENEGSGNPAKQVH